MNKLSIVALGFISALSMIGSAHADNWTGFYTGVDLGLTFNNTELKSQQLGFTNPSGNCNISSSFLTVTPGVQLGYMYQFSNYIVSSIEANVAFNTNQNDALTCDCPFTPYVTDRFEFRNQMQSAIKAKVGHAMSWSNQSFLPYLTVGSSFANVGLAYKNEGGDHYSKSTTQAGWLIGAGIEWAFRQHWSLRAEYNYVAYGNTIKLKIPSVYGLLDPNGKSRIDLTSNNVIIALNYWI